MDSLKLKGEYEDYLDQLDIGQTADATANLLGRIDAGESAFYILWTTTYHTYEACPYGSGNYIWATYFYQDEPQQVVLVGESSGGGDAPYWGSTYVTSTITKSKITSTRIDESGGDEDENGDEIVDSETEKFTINITAEGLLVPVE